MTDAHQRKFFDRLLSDADIARAILPHMGVLAPVLISVIDRATDGMIAERDLPEPAIEGLHDFGNFLTRAAEAMFAARAQASAGGDH